MAQNGGPQGCHPGYLPEIPFGDGQSVPAEEFIPAGGEVLLAPVGGVVAAPAVGEVVNAADPVVKA